MTVRTRIAPSPTGDPHVGTAYVALFNKMFAKSQQGTFILRLEDTDQFRSKSVFETKILESLRWLGLEWDEGPDVGGEYGPYRQSERKHIYQEYAEKLLSKGHAFRCFCSADRVQRLRAEQAVKGLPVGYDGHCMKLETDVLEEKIQSGEPFVVRMKVPRKGKSIILDMLRGNIEIEWAQVDMQVLIKSDGMPTYHLANVVDDHLMKITHVIRGEEWINSAPKHQLLYQYFGWDMPVLCHVPLLRNPDKSKLSKRKNPTSIIYYRRMGYLPEALVNYLGRMGWSMPDEREKFSLEDMLRVFDISRMSLGAPIFDLEKLDWLNGCWIRENLTDDQFLDRVRGWLINREYVMKFLPLAKERVHKLSDLIPLSEFMFSGMLSLTPQSFEAGKLGLDEGKKILQFSLWEFDRVDVWTKDALFTILKKLSKGMAYSLKDFNYFIFVAVAGTPNSWSILDTMECIGSDMTRARLRHAVVVLGGISKKENKVLEKEYKRLSLDKPLDIF